MNWERALLKLRWDGPAYLGLRVLDSWRRRGESRRRRRTWSSPDPSRVPRDIGPIDLSGARRLWPGATDRSWIAAAPARWPELWARAAERAAAAAEGRFDLLGSGWVSAVDADGRIRWHTDFKSGAAFPSDCLYLDVPIGLGPEGTDIKVPWELSRFQHVLAFIWTEPDRYRDVFLRQWEDWLAANPPARGVNWACAMDVALRAISWTAALAAWGQTFDEATLRKMGAALATHGHFIRDNLESIFGARTNHYFSDVVGLAVLGAALTGYPPAGEWAAFAGRELRREIQRQFGADGFDRECSTTYHRLMLELATLGYVACRVSKYDLGAAVGQRLAAAYRALAVLSDWRGNVPLIGDNDSGRVFPMAPDEDCHMRRILPLGAAVLGLDDLAVEDASPEVALLGGRRALESYRKCESRGEGAVGAALPDSGLFVLGCGADRMVVRCGPLTYRPVGSHWHLDQLSLTLSAGGREFLVDAGQYCYTPWPEWWREFLHSAAHNTVIVDGESQCRVFVLSRMSHSIINQVAPTCVAWNAGPQEARFVGRHRGYRRLPGGADHERAVEFDARRRTWLVRDRLPLAGQHRIEWRFRLHPSVAVQRQGTAWQLEHDGSVVTLRWPGAAPPPGRVEEGWYAPAYGRKIPTRVLVFGQVCNGPVEQRFVLQAEERG